MEVRVNVTASAEAQVAFDLVRVLFLISCGGYCAGS